LQRYDPIRLRLYHDLNSSNIKEPKNRTWLWSVFNCVVRGY